MTITVVNQKGGVGKTTTAVTLAHGLALMGRGLQVLLVDLGPQGQCASLLGREQEAGVFRLLVGEQRLMDVVRTTGRRNLWLLPGNKQTQTAQLVLNAQGFQLKAISEMLLPSRVDVVVIDTAPAVGGFQEGAMWAADLVVVPSAMDYLSTESVVETLATLRTLQTKHGWRGRLLGILPTFYDEKTRASRKILNQLKNTFGGRGVRVLAPIHRATVLRDCAAKGKTIWEVAPRSRAAREYAELVWECGSVGVGECGSVGAGEVSGGRA